LRQKLNYQIEEMNKDRTSAYEGIRFDIFVSFVYLHVSFIFIQPVLLNRVSYPPFRNVVILFLML